MRLCDLPGPRQRGAQCRLRKPSPSRHRVGGRFCCGRHDALAWANSAVIYTKFLQTRLGLQGHIGSGGREALVDMQFMPISIQALVARTNWLRGIGISQPVGAVGQDSYFFQQMLYYAKKFATVPTAA